jgi:hypothetical protein
MAVPDAIYIALAINVGPVGLLRGWAIPAQRISHSPQ